MAEHFVLAKADKAFAVDPYPTYRHLRETAPVCRQPDGSVFLSRYDDVRRVIADAESFSSDKKVDFLPKFGATPLYEHHTTSLVFNDPPYHTRVRRLLGPFFTVQAMRRMETSVAAQVDELLVSAAEKRVIDVMREFALAIPLTLIGDLLGVPRAEREPLRRWASLILGALEPVRTPAEMAEGQEAVREFKSYLKDLIAIKRRHGAAGDPDVLDALIADHERGDGLTIDEIVHNCIFMLNAGHDTTTSLIANGVDLLLRFPEQRARLVADPSLMRTAIEEMLRFESPLQIGNRKARVDCENGRREDRCRHVSSRGHCGGGPRRTPVSRCRNVRYRSRPQSSPRVRPQHPFLRRQCGRSHGGNACLQQAPCALSRFRACRADRAPAALALSRNR